MANPTTYFGWVMPNSADLVTDLPADFNVFGQGVDTSMQYLLGGTTGQILSKTSGTNMAFTWINNDQGDITAVTAGTGITGGGTSGAVTVTNDMATTITTAGDLIKGTGSGTYNRLGIGSTSQVLTVVSGAPAWATPAVSTPTFVGASIYNSASFSIVNNTATRITCNSEFFDTDSFHDTSTNTARLTIPAGKAGKYLINMGVAFDANGTGYRSVAVYKNGASFVELFSMTGSSGGNQTPKGSVVVSLAVADYVELFAQQTSGTTLTMYAREYEHPIQITYLGA